MKDKEKQEKQEKQEKLKILRELKKQHENSTEFAKDACDEGFCVSMAEGRRLFNNL